jgi:hypothetical protein
MKRLIATVVASAMVVGSTGSAMAHKAKRPHKHRPAAHHVQAPYAYNHYRAPRRTSNNNGAALAIGLLAVGTIAAIAASKNGGNVNFGYGTHYGPQPYVPPPAYGYGGYAPAGYGYAPAYAPPPVREYEREKVVEYRREYERVREVGY